MKTKQLNSTKQINKYLNESKHEGFIISLLFVGCGVLCVIVGIIFMYGIVSIK